MKKCDLCGKEKYAGKLYPLLEEWRISGVKEICGSCINELEEEIVKTKNQYMREAMMDVTDWWRTKCKNSKNK